MARYLAYEVQLFQFVSYAAQGEKLYEVAGIAATWPPRKVETEEGVHIKQGLTSKQAGDAMLEAHPLPLHLVSEIEFNARADKTTPWFRIAPVVKYLRIQNEAWRLMLSNYLRANVAYPTCGAHDSSFDRSQTCHRCGGPYRHARHQAVVHAFLRSCSKFGILASEQFSLALGVGRHEKRPDVIVHRNVTNDCPLVLDMSIAHPSAQNKYNALVHAWNVKHNKYDEWRADVVECAPMILSTFTNIHHKSLNDLCKLRDISSNRGFVTDCVSRMKVALVNFEPYRRKALKVREQAGTLASDPCVEEPE